MKKFEHKTKAERRRVLLSKNYANVNFSKEKLNKDVYSDADNRTGTGVAVLMKVQGINRRVIAIALAIAFLMTTVVIGFSFLVKADNETYTIPSEPHLTDGGIRNTGSNVVDLDGLYTEKNVTLVDEEEGIYNVKLEAFAEEDSIEQPITDIVLTMDLSDRMDVGLFERNYKNLNTHTRFIPISTSDATYNAMHDKDNPYNSISIDVFNNYSSNKYVKDPNTPGVYVYLASKYFIDFAGQNGVNAYQYTFTDTLGNVYESNVISKSIADSLSDSVETIHFSLKGDPIGDAAPNVDISDFYQRENAETNALTSELIQYAGTLGAFGNEQTTRTQGRRTISFRVPLIDYVVELVGADTDIDITTSIANYEGSNLWIYSDSGERLPVQVSVEQTHYVESYTYNYNFLGPRSYVYTFEDHTYISKYIFTATDPETGKIYRAVQGNSQYGAEHGVFQGFKVYELDENDNLVVVHGESIESKSLYVDGVHENVTRLQAMKEAAEKFIIDVHTDAFSKNPDLSRPNVRLSVITYGLDANVLYNLPEINLSNEVQVNEVIDKIYSLQASDRNAAQLDEAMIAAKTQFDRYSTVQATPRQDDNDNNKDNKKISVLFSSGVPSKESYRWILFVRTIDDNAERQFNVQVANSAIATANDMKTDLGVLSYTVGLFNGASTNDDDKHGDEFTYSGQIIGHQSLPVNGNIGEIWGTTAFTDLINNLIRGRVIETDVPATNRVMDYISSNFSDVTDVGLQWGTNWNPRGYLITTGGSGYKILNNYTSTADGYYFAIDTDGDASSQLNTQMQGVFDQIASEIQIPNSTLNDKDSLIDYITEFFDVEGTIDAYTLEKVGNTWAETTNSQAADGDLQIISPNNENYIEVTGFDYMGHNMSSSVPLKVVLDFNVKRKSGLIGGNDIPTNTALAGVYDNVFDDQNHLVNSLLEEAFEIPHVDLPIETEAATKDASVYFGSVQNLAEVIDLANINGFNNSFVDIEYEIYDEDGNWVNTYYVENGSSVGIWKTPITADENGENIQNLDSQYLQLDKTSIFRVEMIVHPEIRSGTLEETDITDGEGPEATVYVFTPHVTVHNDELDEPTNSYPLSSIPATTEWRTKNSDGSDLTSEELATARALLPVDKDNHSIVPEVSYTIITTDEGKTAVSETNVGSYPISDTQNFQVVSVEVETLPFTFEALQDVRYVDQYDETGNVVESHTEKEYVIHYVNMTEETPEEGGEPTPEEEDSNQNRHEWGPVSATSSTGTVSYTNTDDSTKNDGEFIITVGKFFDLSIDKEFTGDFANAQAITITVTPLGDNDSPDTANAQSVTFAADAFFRSGNKFVSNGAQSVSHLDSNKSYLITETFAADSGDANEPEKEKYDILFVVTSNNQTITDGDGNETNNEFKLVKGDDENAVSIVVTNQAKNIPITGVADETDSYQVLLYILVGVIVLSGSAGGIYFYKKKNEFIGE